MRTALVHKSGPSTSPRPALGVGDRPPTSGRSMPYKANEARRHKIPRARYRVTNWPDYDRALQQRGSSTVWVTPEALAAWHPPRTGRRGRSPQYADLAIETGHLLRLAFGRPWRQTEGLLRSLATLLGLDIGVPDHTTFSRRSPGLALARSLAQAQRSGPVHVVIDATGLVWRSEGSSPVAVRVIAPRACIRQALRDPNHDAAMRIGGEAPGRRAHSAPRLGGHACARVTATSDRHRRPATRVWRSAEARCS